MSIFFAEFTEALSGRRYPDSHHSMQDDPKHTSRLATIFQDNEINWWKTPSESPDCNPIENLWLLRLFEV